MKKNIKALFCFLFFCFSKDMCSQYPNIFFSVTGDTVCYSSIYGQMLDSIHGSYTTFIINRSQNGVVRHKSYFELVCTGASNKCIETLPKDTINKYHLEFDGVWLGGWSNKDFIISVKPSNTHTVNVSPFGPKYIFKTTVSVDISCKEQKLYSKTFDIEFKGNTPQDFSERDIVRFSLWRKRNGKKYFVDFSVKEHQTFKKPGDSEDSRFENFQFIL